MESGRKIIGWIFVLMLLGAFLWSTHSILSPFLIGGILFFVLLGFKDDPVVRRMMIGIVIILFIWFFLKTRGVLFPFLVAFILAYLFDPLADLLERWHIPRLLGTFLILLVTVGALVLAGMILIPTLVEEIENLIAGIPDVAKTVFDSIQTGLPRILQFLRIDSAQLEQSLLEEIPTRIEGVFVNLLKGVVGVGAFLGQIFNLIIIPLLTFYFLKDFNRLKEAFLDIVPRKNRAICIFYAWRMNRILGGYLRGQLIVCVIVGVFTGIGLTLFRIPFAILIGVAAGILNIIPFVGYWITLGLCVLTALFTPDILISLIKIVGVFLTIQVIEAYVISPKIVGERVGLHPLAVIFSVLVFAKFLGFIGLLIAVPTTALLKFLLDEWRRRQKWKEILDGKTVPES